MIGITRYSSLFIFCGCLVLFGCDSTDTQSSKGQKASNNELLPDSLLKLVNEIGLCEGWHTEAEGHTGTCNASIHTRVLKIKPADAGYLNLLFEGRGGSGGSDIRIYRKLKDEYQLIQSFFGVYDTIIPSEITNGFYDIFLSFKDYERGIKRAQFKWDGKNYVLDRMISINGVPMQILEKIGIVDQEKCEYNDSLGLVISERAPFDKHVYAHNAGKGFHKQVVLNTSGESGFAFFLSDHYNNPLQDASDSIWLFRDRENNYELIQRISGWELTALSSHTNGYYDLLSIQYQQGEEIMVHYKWNGEKYLKFGD